MGLVDDRVLCYPRVSPKANHPVPAWILNHDRKLVLGVFTHLIVVIFDIETDQAETIKVTFVLSKFCCLFVGSFFSLLKRSEPEAEFFTVLPKVVGVDFFNIFIGILSEFVDVALVEFPVLAISLNVSSDVREKSPFFIKGFTSLRKIIQSQKIFKIQTPRATGSVRIFDMRVRLLEDRTVDVIPNNCVFVFSSDYHNVFWSSDG